MLWRSAAARALSGRVSLVLATVVCFTLSFTMFDLSSTTVQTPSKRNPVALPLQTTTETTPTTVSSPPQHLHHTQGCEPSMESELARRQVEIDVRESGWFIEDLLNQLVHQERGKSGAVLVNVDRLKNVLEDVQDRRRVTQMDLRRLRDMDGLATWREREAAELSDLIQRRLHALQHPPDCNRARLLVCRVDRGCGTACRMHHLLNCMHAAYGSQRTLVLQSIIWPKLFLPISDKCNTSHLTNVTHWPSTGLDGETRVIRFPDWDRPEPPPQYMPMSLPRDIWQRLVRLHGEPGAWWVGQFFKYLLRPNKDLRDLIQSLSTALNFQTPIVGVHVRRTDKILEAKYHDLEEYMVHVEEYYRSLEVQQVNVTRRVYLSSDERDMFSQAKMRYPHYQFLYNPESERLGDMKKRRWISSVLAVMTDIYMLSRCSYLVCTFSSNVGLLAYEIMQTLHPDASSHVRSLDIDYHVHFLRPRYFRARLPHSPRRREEMLMHEGDHLMGSNGRHFPSNHHNGFSMGTNTGTNKTGLYPYYKVVDLYDIVNYTSYAHIDATGSL